MRNAFAAHVLQLRDRGQCDSELLPGLRREAAPAVRTRGTVYAES
jgi:hypothetical protein